MLDKFNYSTLKMEGLFPRRMPRFHPLVHQRNRNPAVQKRQLTQTRRKYIPRKYYVRENFRIRMECHHCTVFVRITKTHQRRRCHPARKFDLPGSTIPVHHHAQPGTQGVYARYTYPMQTTGYLVGAVVKFTPGMQHCKHHFHRRLAFPFVHVHRNTATIIHHAYRIVRMHHNFDL